MHARKCPVLVCSTLTFVCLTNACLTLGGRACVVQGPTMRFWEYCFSVRSVCDMPSVCLCVCVRVCGCVSVNTHRNAHLAVCSCSGSAGAYSTELRGTSNFFLTVCRNRWLKKFLMGRIMLCAVWTNMRSMYTNILCMFVHVADGLWHTQFQARSRHNGGTFTGMRVLR